MQSPVFNDYLKLNIDGHTIPQFFPKLLLWVYVRELHSSLVSDPEDGVLKEARDVDNNIIISDSTLRSLLPPLPKKLSARYKLMCGCEFCISSKIIHSTLLAWRDWYLQTKIKIKSKIPKTEVLVKDKIAYIKHIKIHSCHMGVIFMPNYLIWQGQQYVHIHSQIMHYHTGNVYCDVVTNFQVLIFLTKKQMINILTLDLQFDFTSII